MTCLELVHAIAREHGASVTDDEADRILWEHTGFPAFWPEGFEKPSDALRHQLHEYFEGTTT